MSSLLIEKSSGTMFPFLESSLSALSITPGLTVDICGLFSGHTIVAMMFPPNAGLVCLIFPSSGSISSFVQSAVSPVSTLDAILGARSLPI